MDSKQKGVQRVADSLGYNDKAIRRDSLEDALQFMAKIADRCPENIKHDVTYAAQVVVNTLAWTVAEKVYKESNDG